MTLFLTAPGQLWHEQYMLYIKFNTAVILITSYLPLVLLSSVKISDEIHHAIGILSLFLSTLLHCHLLTRLFFLNYAMKCETIYMNE